VFPHVIFLHGSNVFPYYSLSFSLSPPSSAQSPSNSPTIANTFYIYMYKWLCLFYVYVYLWIYLPYMRESMWLKSFWTRFTSLNMMLSTYIHLLANDIISFFLMAEKYYIMCIYKTFS
jgi:hypothetical protein